MSFSVQAIDHVEVFVRSIPDAVRWYGEVLGLREVARWDPEPVMIGAGGTMLALFEAKEGVSQASEANTPGLRWRRVAWRTDRAGFDAAIQHLHRLKISFRGPIDHRSALSIYFRDPDGLPLEITCPAR